MTDPDITLILPAYNEAATIRKTVSEAVEFFKQAGLECEIVVAADGNDGTRELCRGMGLRVIGAEGRRGKGRGVREAVEIAAGRFIGYADADNKVPIAEFAKVEPLLRRGAEVVIGSRALERKLIERRQPLYRRAGSRAFNAVVRAFVGLGGIADTQCGFKFFQKHAAKELFRRQRVDGYMFDVEILMLARRLGYRIEQVPVRWRDDGDSRLQVVSGNLRNALDILRIRFGGLRP